MPHWKRLRRTRTGPNPKKGKAKKARKGLARKRRLRKDSPFSWQASCFSSCWRPVPLCGGNTGGAKCESIRKRLFRKGIPLFGLQRKTTAAATAIGCASIFLAVSWMIPPHTPATGGLKGGAISLEFVLLGPGDFVMGSPKTEPQRWDDEDQQPVRIDNPFFMQTKEITQKQWETVMGNNPSSNKGCDGCPVEDGITRTIRLPAIPIMDGHGAFKVTRPSWSGSALQEIGAIAVGIGAVLAFLDIFQEHGLLAFRIAQHLRQRTFSRSNHVLIEGILRVFQCLVEHFPCGIRIFHFQATGAQVEPEREIIRVQPGSDFKVPSRFCKFVFDQPSSFAFFGKTRVKTEPSPGVLSTVTVPPWAWTMCFTMASPRPVPPSFRLLALSMR